MKKKILFLSLLCFVVTGCSNLSNKSIDSLLPILLKENNKHYNVVYDGYKYYIPKGIRFTSKKDYNAILLDEKNRTYYFYSDVIRYYNKEKLDYKVNKDAYYSKELNYNGKSGYLEITKLDKDDSYFIEFMYNYGKIEAIVKEKEIIEVLPYMSSILNSITYNRVILDTLIGKKVLNYKEETYNVMKPKGNEKTKESYLDYEEKYGTYEGYTEKNTDEDKIDIEQTE